MKTLNNLFGKSTNVKNISDFSHLSLTVAQMIVIKGGTLPVGDDDAGTPTPPPPKGL